MRAIFLFVVVALTSVARADDEPAAPPTEAQAEAALWAESPESPATAAPDAARAHGKATSGRTTITITASSVIISYGKGEPQPPYLPGSRAIVVCDSFTMESAAGEQPKLHCQQCEVILPNGSTGQAGDVTFDSSTKKLTLTGADEQPVRLISNDQSGGQEIVSAKMDIQLKFARSQPSFPQAAPATYYTPQPLTGVPPTIKPEPTPRPQLAE